MRQHIVLIFICLSIFACSGSKTNSPSGADTSRDDKNQSTPSAPETKEPKLPDTWFTKALQQTKLNCNGECPKNIGMAAFYQYDFGEDTFIEQCTTFAVSNTIVATNSHCIKQAIKDNEESCEHQLGFVFPKGDGINHYRLCKKVLAVSNIKNGMDLDDYAFIEVEPLNVEPLKIAQTGIPDNTKIYVHKINPNEDGTLGGTYQRTSCTTVQKSLLNLYYIHQFSRTALAIGCEARGGNSGAPVLNENNEVVGLLQSKKVSDYLLHLGQELARKSELELPSDPPNHFVFSNLACIPHPITGEKNITDCSYYRDRNLAFIFNLVVDPSLETFGTIKSKWRYKLPQAFNYHIETLPGFATILTATPTCITKQFLKSNPPGIYNFEFSDFLRIVKQYKFDEQLRFHPITYFKDERTFSRYRLDTTGASPKLFKEVDAGDLKEFAPAYIKTCD